MPFHVGFNIQKYCTITARQTQFQLDCKGKHYKSVILAYSSEIALLLNLCELSLAEDDVQDP